MSSGPGALDEALEPKIAWISSRSVVFLTSNESEKDSLGKSGSVMSSSSAVTAG